MSQEHERQGTHVGKKKTDGQADSNSASAEPQQQNGGSGSGGRNPPAAEFRLGRIRATIWMNHSETQGEWYSVVLTRSYKDAEGNWKTAQSFGRDDLLAIGEVSRQALLWINQQLGAGWRKLQNAGSEQQSPTEEAPPAGDSIPF